MQEKEIDLSIEKCQIKFLTLVLTRRDYVKVNKKLIIETFFKNNLIMFFYI